MLKGGLTDQLYEILRERIVNLEMKLGEKVDTQEIANEFNTSQTPVRDVLNRLAHEGLVNVVPRIGYYIIEPSPEDLAEIYELRKMFECYALRLSVQSVDVNKLSCLKQKMKEIQKEKNLKKKISAYRKVDGELHLSIGKSANNERFQDLFSQIYNLVRVSQSIGLNWDEGLKEHISLIDAMLEKNKDKALKTLETHLENAKKRGMRALRMKLYSLKESLVHE
ncbi:hypothetical protein LCGC14_2425250 [marine sediment metagenome]|uniref:HTH gntR-type domain-containing protein n=1 Tax=marine sediment metagenome TaxID=412755 RepID=A0A0F9CAQ0_9ZZZZ